MGRTYGSPTMALPLDAESNFFLHLDGS